MAKKNSYARDKDHLAALDEILDPKVFLADDVIPPLDLDVLPPLDLSGLDDVLPDPIAARVQELETKLRQVGERLRHLASNVDPKDLEHELHALARECENIFERSTKAEEPRARRARRPKKR